MYLTDHKSTNHSMISYRTSYILRKTIEVQTGSLTGDDQIYNVTQQPVHSLQFSL